MYLWSSMLVFLMMPYYNNKFLVLIIRLQIHKLNLKAPYLSKRVWVVSLYMHGIVNRLLVKRESKWDLGSVPGRKCAFWRFCAQENLPKKQSNKRGFNFNKWLRYWIMKCASTVMITWIILQCINHQINIGSLRNYDSTKDNWISFLWNKMHQTWMWNFNFCLLLNFLLGV